MDLIEVRTIDSEPLEFRTTTEDNGSIGTFSGWAIQYDKPSLPLPFTEHFAPGAFARSLKSRNDIRMYVNHDETMVLGSTRAKTLRITDKPEGLWVDGDLPDTTAGRDLRVLMERGDVYQQSIGFSAVRDEWSSNRAQRKVIEAKLYDSSIVTGAAAYPQSTVGVRNLRVIAYRTHTDADALADAFAAVQAGDTLSDDQAAVLRTMVDELTPKPAEPEPEPFDPAALQALSDLLKRREAA